MSFSDRSLDSVEAGVFDNGDEFLLDIFTSPFDSTCQLMVSSVPRADQILENIKFKDSVNHLTADSISRSSSLEISKSSGLLG